MGNPQRALDAILAGPTDVSGYTIYPLTVARLACLEKIDSPLLTGKNDYAKTVASVWVMTRPAEQLAKHISNPDYMQEQAILWADSVPLDIFNDICKLVGEDLAKMAGLVGGKDEDGKKKALMDG